MWGEVPIGTRGSPTASSVTTALLWAVIALCCGLPLVWMASQLAIDHRLVWGMQFPEYQLALACRTLLYNGAVGVVACLLGWPAALAIGRGRGWIARTILLLTPLCLLIPSLVYTYGWRQAIWLATNRELYPAGPADVVRCIWTLACWLWPIPACGVGLSLRLLDSNVQQQAILDGALWRVTLRQLIGPILASFSLVMLLAMQEFAVYETTGISVIATEVRTVFESGSMSMGVAGRSAAALATALPMVIGVLILALFAGRVLRRRGSAEAHEIGAWPRILNARRWSKLAASLVITATVGLPLAAMALSVRRQIDFTQTWDAVSPQIIGSVQIAAVTGALALVIGLGSTLRRARGLLALAVVSFLIGGQLLAIADIHLYNRGWLGWVYNGPAIMFVAFLGRFAWLPLAAARASWSRPMRQLRDLAAVDGAGRAATAWHVIWPLTWPILGAAGVLVMILSLTEVPATVLLAPQRPPMLIPELMVWVHRLNDEQMVAASLLLCAMVVVLGAAAMGLAWLGLRFARRLRPAGAAVLLLPLLCLAGCGDGKKPKAIWCEVGSGPGQVIYPRAIAYSRLDDSFFIVDRYARIQHLSHDGKYLNEWQMPESKNGKPVGLSVGPDGNVYVADTHYARVMVFRPDGKLLRQWGSMGTGPGQFTYPTDVAFDSRGQIYVSEYGGNDRIQVFDGEGKFVSQFGREGCKEGEFCRPQSMLIDGDVLYVADACNHRIQVFKTDGTFVRTFGQCGAEAGQFRFPYGLDMDSKGNLVISEFGNNRLQKIDPATGRSLGTWGSGGHDPGQLANPWAVAVDKHDRVVVVDSGNNRLQVFEW